jgi:hypothetical protein
MEAVAAASSIIGILGVIGQSVSGLAKLQKFFDEYERAPYLVKKLKGDISGLETTLLEVQETVQLFQKAENVNSSEILKTSTVTLDTQVKLCSGGVKLWVKETEDLNPKLENWFYNILYNTQGCHVGCGEVSSICERCDQASTEHWQ